MKANRAQNLTGLSELQKVSSCEVRTGQEPGKNVLKGSGRPKVPEGGFGTTTWTTKENVLKAGHGDCDRFSVAAIRGRCAHCSACVVSAVRVSSIADLCGWQKRRHSSSSRSGDSVRRVQQGAAAWIKGRCAHCSACYFRVRASAIADLCVWQKRQRGSSSSSGGDTEFAAYNKLEQTFGARAMCSLSCSLLAGKRYQSQMPMAEAVAQQQQQQQRLVVRRV